MTFVNYAKLNSLKEFSLIAGTEYTLEFNVFEDDGITPLDLGGATVKWVLCPYGQPDYTVLEITGTITDTSTFQVVLPSASTRTFSGKYIQQPVIYSFLGSEYRPSQGVVSFLDSITVA